MSDYQTDLAVAKAISNWNIYKPTTDWGNRPAEYLIDFGSHLDFHKREDGKHASWQWSPSESDIDAVLALQAWTGESYGKFRLTGSMYHGYYCSLSSETKASGDHHFGVELHEAVCAAFLALHDDEVGVPEEFRKKGPPQ